MRFTVAITVLSLAILVFFFLAAIVSGKLDFNLWTNIAKDGARDPGRRRPVPPVRDQRDLQVVAVRDLVLPGDRGGAARGRGVDGSAARRPQGNDLGHAHAADRRRSSSLFLNTGVPAAPSCYGASGYPLLDGLHAIFGEGSAAELLGLLFGRSAWSPASSRSSSRTAGTPTRSRGRGTSRSSCRMTHGERKTPHVALIAGAVVGLRRALPRLVPASSRSCGAQIVGGAAQHGGVRAR